MLVRFDPAGEFDRVLDELRGRRPVRGMPLFGYRRDGAFVAEFDLPGVDPDTIDITVEQDVLTVRAERATTPPEGAELVVCERPAGAFERRVYLGDTLDRERIAARYANGVLTVTVPMLQRAKPHKIEITAEPVPVAAG